MQSSGRFLPRQCQVASLFAVMLRLERGRWRIWLLTFAHEVKLYRTDVSSAASGRQLLKNLITDIPGVQVGHADDARLASGVTAIVFDRPAVAAMDVRGGAPGTREPRVQQMRKKRTRVIYRYNRTHSGIPCAMVYGLYVVSSECRAC